MAAGHEQRIDFERGEVVAKRHRRFADADCRFGNGVEIEVSISW